MDNNYDYFTDRDMAPLGAQMKWWNIFKQLV